MVSPPDSRLPSKIGQYVIKRVIASGGMGTVYEAQQENPRRPAAVKVIKRNMASAEALRRFEREAQALARLRHPGIAQIYEAGTFEEGGISLPFFALEYIPNARTITDYARVKNLGVRQKLDLFTQICEAVHYGHQRGIIHRDLKPANILVDSEGRVRIIDFGVARAVDADLEQADAQTRVGQIVGTAQYMSPEQFEADPNDLDTRSDVYALGVVLFELLTGQLPYDIEKTGIFEIARMVREEPAKSLGSVSPGTDNEVELIVGKALNKDRELRYQSAFGLAEDIRHYLKGEAISARTTSFSYQTRVFARRNKAVVGLAATLAVLLVGGILWTSKFYVDVSAERNRTEAAAAQAIAANDFLKSTLNSVVPPGFGDVRTIGDLCDRVAQDLDGAFPNDPVTEADIRLTIGHIYMALDKREESEFQFRKAFNMRKAALGPAHELTLTALNDLYTFYFIFGPGKDYLATAREYHQILVEKLGPEDPETLDAWSWVIEGMGRAGDYSTAERESGKYCRIVEGIWGDSSPETMSALLDHSQSQMQAGLVEEAVETAQRAYEICGDLPDASPDTRRAALNIYASNLVAAGNIAEAKELYGHRKIPASLGLEMEFQPPSVVGEAKVKVLVFFETWCPFSQRFIPKVERMNRQYGDLGVEIVGLTKITRSSNQDQVRQFISDNQVSFGVYQESGRLYNYFNIIGVPQTVILHEDEVVWESIGAGWMESRMIEGLLETN
jgi:non-specific serine/threonine protein kinase/serine/threonine-protein kinase